MAFHLETQGTLFTLLVPFRNVISERRTLQNKSGEIYGRKSGESGESGEINCMFWGGTMELLPRGLSSGNTRNVLNVACSVPKCNFGSENAPE